MDPHFLLIPLSLAPTTLYPPMAPPERILRKRLGLKMKRLECFSMHRATAISLETWRFMGTYELHAFCPDSWVQIHSASQIKKETRLKGTLQLLIDPFFGWERVPAGHPLPLPISTASASPSIDQSADTYFQVLMRKPGFSKVTRLHLLSSER